MSFHDLIGFVRRLSVSSVSGLLKGLLCLLILCEAPCLFATVGFPVRYNGTLSILANGSLTSPQGVAVDLDGNVYIADTGGNRIIKVAPGGTAAVFSVSLSGTAATFSSPRQLAVDSAGTLYIADTGNNRIVKSDPSGAGSILSIGSSLSPATLNAPQGVAVATSGDVYIADTGNSRIVKIPSSGSPSVAAITGLTSPSSLSSPKGLAFDMFQNLYVVDSGNNRVVKVTTALAGSVLSTSGGLTAPVAVGVGMNGVVYVVDGTNRIAIVTPHGDTYDLFFDEVNSELTVPSAIAVSPTGTVYVADSETDQVNAFQVDTAGFPAVSLGSSGTPQTLRFIVNSTATLTGVAAYTLGTPNLDFTVAANSGTPCTTGSNTISCTVNVQFTPTAAGLRRGALVLSYTDTSFGTGSITVPLFGYGNAPVAALSPSVASVVSVGSVSVAQPFQTARDGVGNIYVTSYQNSTLLKIPSGGGSGSTVTIPSLPTPHTINSPTGLAIDGAGNLFIADYNNSRIVEVTPAGTSKVIAIRGLSTSLSFPTTLNFTANGRLLVDDYGNGRVVLLSPDIYNSATNSGDGTVGFAAAYVLPLGSYTLGSDNSTGVASDAMGNVYFTDQNTNPGRIIKVDPLGKLTTVSLPNVTLNAPLGVAVDPSQNLYVVDSGNQRVIQQTTSGATSIVKYSGASIGQFVFGLDVDGSGNELISDFSNNRLILNNVSQSAQSFPSTRQYTNSVAKVTTVTNLGNQSLIFSANPTYTANFSQDTTDTNACTSDTSLSAGTSCDVPIIFSPQAVGSLSANITVTNDSQNVAGTTQQIAVSGTSTNPGDTTSVTKTSPALSTYSYGQPITISVQVKDLTNTNAVPTGSVTFTDALTSTITQKTLDSGGNATLLSSNVLNGIGTHSILASYGGVSGSYQGSSTTIGVTVTADTVAVTGPSAVSVTKGQSGTASITVSPTIVNGSFASGAALPSGTLTYSILSGSTAVSGPTTATLTAGSSSSSATLTIPNTLAAGSYTISVAYSGDGNYQSASAVAIPLTIAQLNPTILWSPSSSITSGTSLSALLNATAVNGSTSIPGTFLYTATPSGGSATAVTASTILGAGTYVLTATFTPTDTTTYTTQSLSKALTVGKATPTVSLVSSLNPVVLTNAVSFTATVASTVGVPSGTIGFYDGTALLANVTMSSKQAVYTTSSLAVGTHAITAVYSGDNNFLSITSSAVSELVQDFTISTPSSTDTNTPSSTVVPGGTATYNLNIGPSAGTVFPAPVTLSLSGLPPGATGTLSPSTLPAGSSLSSVTLTIQLPKTAAVQTEPRSRMQLAVTMLAVLFLPLAGRIRRTAKGLRRFVCLLIFLIASASFMVGLSGCGTKSSGYFGDSVKNYTIYIIATSGSLSHSTSVTLTVQ